MCQPLLIDNRKEKKKHIKTPECQNLHSIRGDEGEVQMIALLITVEQRK